MQGKFQGPRAKLGKRTELVQGRAVGRGCFRQKICLCKGPGVYGVGMGARARGRKQKSECREGAGRLVAASGETQHHARAAGPSPEGSGGVSGAKQAVPDPPPRRPCAHSYRALATEHEALMQKYLHLLQIVETEKTVAKQLRRQIEDGEVEIERLKAEVTAGRGRAPRLAPRFLGIGGWGRP